jgi:hypothetical protein
MDNWNAQLVEQFEWHWTTNVRPRLEGLTDEEYLWEPVPSWSIRPRGRSTAPIQGGSGAYVVEFAHPEPEPAPFTTIAWRISHVVVGVLAVRNASHFDAPPADYNTWEYAGTADEALAQLDRQLDTWLSGVRSLGEDGLCRPCGPAEGPFAERPLSVLVLHINRELIHHASEICLLRDLYRHSNGRTL